MDATTCFGLTEIARATVDDTDYVIYSDGAGRWAVDADAYDDVPERYHGNATLDEYSEGNRYSLWCSEAGVGVGDRDLAVRIAREAGEDVIFLAGVGTRIDVAKLDADAAAQE